MDHDTTDIDQATKPNRRTYGWWMFFTLLVLLVAICLPVVIRYQRQLALIERIESVRGIVNTKPVGPEWLRDILGEQRMRGFDNVTGINASYSLIDDKWLNDISRFTSLRYLRFDSTQISDAGLVHLKGLTRLKWLYLRGTQVTESGVKELKIAFPSCEIYWGEE